MKIKRDTYDAEIKVRVPGWLKKALETMALREDLELSDIARRAFKKIAFEPNTQSHS